MKNSWKLFFRNLVILSIGPIQPKTSLNVTELEYQQKYSFPIFIKYLEYQDMVYFSLSFQGTTEDDRPFKFRSGIAPTLNYTGWVFDTYSWSQIIYERFINYNFKKFKPCK